MKDLSGLGGHSLELNEIERIQTRVGLTLPDRLVQMLLGIPLVGVTFVLDADTDHSGLGVELRWMNPDQMISEALDVYPGILAAPLGFLPVGICLEGSGDPYFVRLQDLALVRISHEAACGSDLDLDKVEVVVISLEEFLDKAAATL